MRKKVIQAEGQSDGDSEDDSDLIRNTRNWTLESRVRTYQDRQCGSAIFFFGRMEDLSATPEDPGSPASVEIVFEKNDENTISVIGAALNKDHFNQSAETFFADAGAAQFSPAEWLDVEIRFTDMDLTPIVIHSQIQLILNGVCIGHWKLPVRGPLRWKARDVHFLALGSGDLDSAIVDLCGDTGPGSLGASFDDFQLFTGSHIAHADCSLSSVYEFGTEQFGNRPFKQFFCNDFGFVDGSQYDFDVNGISWRRVGDDSQVVSGDAFAYWVNEVFDADDVDDDIFVDIDPDVLGYVETNNGKHNYSEGYQKLFYFDIAQSTAGSVWSILPVNRLRFEDELIEFHGEFTSTFIDVVSNSIEALSVVEGGTENISVQINPLIDGKVQDQRSMVVELIVTYDSYQGPFDAGSFVLVHSHEGVTQEVIPTVSYPEDGGAILTFPEAEGFEGNSLADGNYKLWSLICNGNSNDSPSTNCFFRLFGDSDGNRTVNVFDLVQFRRTWLSQAGDEDYDFSLDHDADGTVGTFDLLMFKRNYGTTLE